MLSLFRIKDWLLAKIFFNLTFLIGVYYYTEPEVAELMYGLLLFLVYIGSIGAFGYFINDCFDIHYDKVSGKENLTGKLTSGMRFAIAFVIPASCVIIFILAGRFTTVIAVLLVLQIILLVWYSMPFAGLKGTSGGLLADALFSFVLPAFISMALAGGTLDTDGVVQPGVAALLFWLLAVGLRSIMLHQVHDYENDIRSGQKTFTTKASVAAVLKIVQVVFIAEVFFLSALALTLPDGAGRGVLLALVLYFFVEFVNNPGLIKNLLKAEQRYSRMNELMNYYFFVSAALLNALKQHPAWLLCVIPFVIIKREEFYFMSEKFYHRVFLFFYRNIKNFLNRKGKAE